VILARLFTGGIFAENGYLAVCGETRTTLVIDPGASARDMERAIGADGLDVQAIVLTHAHLDHVEGVGRIKEATGAPIYLHAADRALYDAVQAQAAAFGLPLPSPLPPPEHEISHGDVLEFGSCALDVRHVPGHAPGHVILYSERDHLAFVGDVVFAGSIGRTDLPGGDFRTLIAGIRAQVLTLPDETRLLTGHGPETTVGNERVGNPFLTPHYGGELA
jgi:glyoxylase-like metal-dependent hydrolase (beta-lactamase superfamily II)